MPTMKAALVTDQGLQIREIPVPEPKADEILVRNRAIGLNRADLGVAAGGLYGHIGGPGTVPGLECAGEVAAVGSAVTGFKPGDRVMCAGNNTYAEYALCDWGRAAHIPANNMTYAQAATLPVALQTMHDAVVTNGRLRPGETVLIQGASSGVGLMALQIAKFKGAALVIGSSTNPARRERLKEFGADLAIDSKTPDWVETVLQATGGKGVDLIVDQVSASVANQNMKAAAILGRIVNVGRLGGKKGEFDFDLHALRRIDYIGVTFRTRTVEEVRALVQRMRADLWPAVEAGKFHLPIDRTFTLDQAAEAQAYMRSNGHFGKIVLTVDPA